MNRIIEYCVAVLMFMGCTKAPTDEQVKDLFGKVHQTLMNKEHSFEENDKQAGELLLAAGKEFDVMKMEAGQFGLQRSWNTLFRSKAVKSWMAPRLAKLSARNDTDGALAAYYQMVYNPRREKGGYSFEEAEIFLKHPAVGKVFEDEVVGPDVVRKLVDDMGGEVVRKADLIRMMMPYVTDRMPKEVVKVSVSLLNQALSLEELMSAEDLECLRKSLLQQQERMLTGGDSVVKKWAVGNIIYLNSLIAQGKLIGGEAPAIDFLWCSDGRTKHLSDLKGKVVVLDFWATWCGSCVLSFPNVRELQKRYKGFPVEFIGITSLQGRHIKRSGDTWETIDTKENPEKEFELMTDFMKEMKMNWKVAFSSGNVFNPEYGVKGIPHAVIVDVNGKVRFNELRPYDPPFVEAEKIDVLLKEAGLACPKEPMVQTNYVVL